MGENSKILEKLLKESRRIEIFINTHALGYFIPAGHDREQYAANNFYISLDWYRAVVLLTDGQLRGPALTLIRPMLESWIKGTWIKLVASDHQIQKLIMDSKSFFRKTNKKGKSTRDLIDEVKKKDKVLGGMLESLWDAVEQDLHDCIHGNNQYLNLYLNKKTRTIEGNVGEDLMAVMLDRTNLVALVAALQMREVHTEDQRISDKFKKKLNEYLDYSTELLEPIVLKLSKEESGTQATP